MSSKLLEDAKVKARACRKTGDGTALYTAHIVLRDANLLKWRHRACSCTVYYVIASELVVSDASCMDTCECSCLSSGPNMATQANYR
jgi:hypothetical protein